MKSLSLVLKQLRESRDITILKLSEISGVANGTIGDIERGKSNGSKKTLEKISNALKLTSKEKDELYTAYLGRNVSENIDPRVLNLKKRERLQYDDFMNEAILYFQDEKVSDEDKQKLINSLQEAFFEIKFANKRK